MRTTSRDSYKRFVLDTSRFVRLSARALIASALLVSAVAAEAAVTFTVNSPSDVPDANPGDGKCETAPGNGVCTLRAAIQETNALSGADTIILQPNVTYLLTRAGDDATALNGDLDITDSLTITGAAGAIIDGNGGVTNDRVFEISQCIGNAYDSMAQKCTIGNVVVSISDVTIQNGKSSYTSSNTNAFAGGIWNNGNLTLTNVTVTGNSANANTGAAYGGGIYSGGPLKLTNCVVSNNQVTTVSGGIASGAGIEGSPMVINSTISGNTARDYGGGIDGAPTVIGSTITGNRASNGGGLHGTGILINSTVSGNSAKGDGGGISVTGGATISLYNVTVAGNTAKSSGTGSGSGGGIRNNQGTVNMQNSIVAYNIHATATSQGLLATDDDFSGTVSSGGHNIISSSTGCTVSGGGVTFTDPALDALADNGGPTQTRALRQGSPAVDAGNPGGCTDNLGAPLTTDQRGFSRPYPTSNPCDIGAFELQPLPTPTPTATPTPTPIPTPTPTATPTPSPTPASQLLNLSTRKQVGTGDNVLIGGFIVVGTEDKKVLLRGLGPSLPVSGALADPTLELHASDTTLLAFDDNWRDKQADEINATGIPPSNDLESAIVATLSAKAGSEGGAGYTGVLAGQGGTQGIGLLEIYDLNAAANSKLANISTRGFVGTGDDLLIGGFIPGPSDRAPLKVLVRALGPSLAAQGVSAALQDPLLELHDGNGVIVVQNDNWRDASNAAEIQATLPPPDDHESAIITTLAPSNAGYTALVRGANATTGVALVEVYALQ
jgi:CSLREA domain-containing protein